MHRGRYVIAWLQAAELKVPTQYPSPPNAYVQVTSQMFAPAQVRQAMVAGTSFDVPLDVHPSRRRPAPDVQSYATSCIAHALGPAYTCSKHTVVIYAGAILTQDQNGWVLKIGGLSPVIRIQLVSKHFSRCST